MTTDEAQLRQRVDNLVEAIRAADLDAVKPMFAPDIVSFDMQPPLRHLGAPAKWRNWAEVFAAFARPIGYEIGELTISADGDLAYAYGLNRLSGTLRNGQRTGMWVRWTCCFRKTEGNWLIAHDHVSVPLDMASGKALVDLEP